MPILAVALKNFVPLDSDRKEMRLICVQNLVKLFAELGSWDTNTSYQRMRDLACARLTRHKELGHPANDSGEVLWQLAPKHRLFNHVVDTLRSSPKVEWCYADEDETGRATEVATAENPLYVSRHLLKKIKAHFRAMATACFKPGFAWREIWCFRANGGLARKDTSTPQ